MSETSVDLTEEVMARAEAVVINHGVLTDADARDLAWDAVRAVLPDIEAAVREQTIADVEARIEAFIRHGEAVPADVTTYTREAVHNDLRILVSDLRGEQQ